MNGWVAIEHDTGIEHSERVGEPLAAEHGMLPVRAAVADPERMCAWESDPAPWVARMLAAAEFLGELGQHRAVLPAPGPPG